MHPTLYDILGVSPDASREEIRAAWREAADRFEPGQGGGTRQFRLFNEAAEVLLDPERRKAYDAQLAGGERPPQTSAQTPPDKTPDQTPPGQSPDRTPAQPAGAAAGEQVTPEPTRADPPVAASASAEPAAEQAARESVSVRAARQLTAVAYLVRGWSVTLVVLGLLAVASVALGAYFGKEGLAAAAAEQDAEERLAAFDEAPAAAESAAAAVLSYDYETLEADRDAAAKFLTEDYRREYVDTFDKLVTESATATRAKVEAQVLASSTMVGASAGGDTVPVLIFVDQYTTSTANDGERTRALNRVRFDMVEVDGTWLVDGITSY